MIDPRPWTRVLRVTGVVLVAIAMAAGFAHLLALPNKIGLSADDYLTVQHIYRGWALLGIPIIGALAVLAILAVCVRRDRHAFVRTLAAAGALAVSLVVFFAFTFPANQATNDWTMLPDDWQALRRRWEYSHAVNAVLYLSSLVLLTLSFLPRANVPAAEPDAERADHGRRRGIATPRSSAARTASS